MRLTRRFALGLIAAGALAPAASAHTIYNQWVVYRRKHLHIGCHRQDDATYDLAQEVVWGINHALPEASARAARAPRPERLASLLGTDQLEIAVLAPDHAGAMMGGKGRFAPYGAIPLTLLADFGSHLLVAHRDMPVHHGWLIAAALEQTPFGAPPSAGSGGLPLHAGAAAFVGGVTLETVLPAD